MSNIKRISQRTGEVIADDAQEPGFIVNMDDENAAAFVAKAKGEEAGSAIITTSRAKPRKAAKSEAPTTDVSPVGAPTEPTDELKAERAQAAEREAEGTAKNVLTTKGTVKAKPTSKTASKSRK